MQQVKFNDNIRSKEQLIKRKSAIMDDLLTKPEIKKLIEDMDIGMEEFNYYLGYFVSYYEDKCFCKSCTNIENCPKEIKGMNLKLVKKEDGSIEREYSLCENREEQRKMHKNYLIRDFNDELLKIDLDSVDNRKGRFKYEKKLMEIDLDKANEGMFIYGASNSGKTYPLIALCNEFVKENKTCAFVEVKNFIDSLKSTFNSNKGNYDELMNVVKSADVLVFDGLGEEKPSEWVRDDVLGTVLEHRNKNHLLTFITSCFTLEEIEKMYNVSKSNSEIGKIRTKKFVEKIKSLCSNIVGIESK